MRWLFSGAEIRIDTRCLDCGEPIVIRVRDEDILEINPAEAVGHVNIAFAKALTGEVSWGMA